VERVFTGIGDAAPNNVTPAMQTCLVRMAETRAKARALRDAVNIGVAAFEELDNEGEGAHLPAQRSVATPSNAAAETPPAGSKALSQDGLTAKQEYEALIATPGYPYPDSTARSARYIALLLGREEAVKISMLSADDLRIARLEFIARQTAQARFEAILAAKGYPAEPEQVLAVLRRMFQKPELVIEQINSKIWQKVIERAEKLEEAQQLFPEEETAGQAAQEARAAAFQ
jgi:hypothetical protein